MSVPTDDRTIDDALLTGSVFAPGGLTARARDFKRKLVDEQWSAREPSVDYIEAWLRITADRQLPVPFLDVADCIDVQLYGDWQGNAPGGVLNPAPGNENYGKRFVNHSLKY